VLIDEARNEKHEGRSFNVEHKSRGDTVGAVERNHIRALANLNWAKRL